MLGPVISAAHRDRIEGYVRAGTDEGGTIVAGGDRPDMATGFYVEPTLIADCKAGMKVVQEEIFGPVVVVVPFDDEDEGVALANGTDFGLYDYVFTKDTARAMRVAKQLRSGNVGINTAQRNHEAPFGGFKLSGRRPRRRLVRPPRLLRAPVHRLARLIPAVLASTIASHYRRHEVSAQNEPARRLCSRGGRGRGELVAPVFAEVEPRGHGEEVGAVLDRLTEPLAFVGEAAGIVDQVTFPQPSDCRGPCLVVPRAGCLERGPGHITRAACRTSASTGSTAPPTRQATCPSPRNSRRTEIACHNATWGCTGHDSDAWAAASGRPAVGQPSAAVRASSAARATEGDSTSSASTRRNALSTPSNRAFTTAAGGAFDHAAGNVCVIRTGLKLKNAAITTLGSTAPMGADRDAK